MSRRSLLLGVAILLLLTGSVAAALVLLVRHERSFYTRLVPPPGREREKESEACFVKLTNLIVNDLSGHGYSQRWEERFTQTQINSYFAEDFLRSGVSKEILPEGITDPRVAIEADRIRLGFRYGKPPWSTVVTLDLRVWLAPEEPNVVLVELQGLHAGGLPISAQSLLERVFEVARRQNIEVTWYRYRGNPTARLRFQSNQPRPSVQLERLSLQDGVLVIGGRSVEPQPLRAMLPTRHTPDGEAGEASPPFADATPR
jgi:hypothetical protein